MKRKRIKPAKPGAYYRQLHRVVDGAIRDTFNMHPEYLAHEGQRYETARRSIAKRVTGALLGYVEQSTQGRSGQEPAAIGEAALQCVPSSDEVLFHASSPSRITTAVGERLAPDARP